MRLGLRGEVYDDFYYGVRLDTSANPRSPWVTLGTSSSGVPYQGPFGKSTAGIDIGQVYIGWKPADSVNLSVGRMPNPLYTTPMVWDPDINPEGFGERFKYTVGEVDLFANFGQFLYQDTNPEKTSSGYFGFSQTKADLPFLLAWQGGFNYHVTKDLNVKVGATIYDYINHGVDQTVGTFTPDFNGTFVGQGSTNNINGTPGGASSGFPNGFYDGFTANQTGINNLEVIDIPWEINYKVRRVNLRMFGDYAQNLDGANRALAAYRAALAGSSPLSVGQVARISSPQTSDTKAYQIGFGIGSTNLIYGPTEGLVYGSMLSGSTPGNSELIGSISNNIPWTRT